MDRARGVRIEISLFGRLQVKIGGFPLCVPARKSQALLAYLSAVPGKPHDREAIHALLWPDSAKAQARASLRQELHALRKAFAPRAPEALRSTDTTIAVDASQVHVDVAALERCAADPTPEALARVPSVCTGPFLDGLSAGEAPFDDWVAFERARLLELAVGALEKLAEHQAAAGHLDRAIQTAMHSLKLEPLQERTHRILMRLYASHGRRAEAVQQYKACAAMLRRELGVEPDQQTQRLHRDLLHTVVSSGLEPLAAIPAPSQPPLVGRDAERARLDTVLGEAWSDSGRLVVLSGDAGVGKTRLLEAVASHAVERGGASLRGRCFETERVLPFALWVDLLKSDRSRLDNALRRMSPAGGAEIARILPPGGSAAPRRRAPNDVIPLFDAIGEIVTRMSDEAPLLIVLEDIHWADAMSLRCLSFLARRAGASSRVCWMASLRSEEMARSGLLRTVLQEVEREGRLLEMGVGPLSRSDTLALVQSLMPLSPGANDGDAFEQIWALSEGNPLVVVETLRGLEQQPIGPGVARLPVPERVRELIASHVARVGREGQDVLATAATIGRRFDFTLLSSASGGAERVVVAAVEDLVRARLLTDTPEGLYFTHDRIREVVYESLLPARRRVLHGSIARALEELCAPEPDEASGAIGYHYARAGDAAASVRYLLRFAARCIHQCGLEEALTALREAQRQTEELPASSRDAAAVETAVLEATCFMLVGRASEMRPALARHRATVDRLSDPALVASFHIMAAFADASAGDRGAVQEDDTRLLAVAERSQDGTAAGRALMQVSHDAAAGGQFQRGIQHGLEAVRMLEASGDTENAAWAWHHLGTNYLLEGEWRSALGAYCRTRELGERIGSARTRAMGTAFEGLVRSVLEGDLERGIAACKLAIDIAPDPFSSFYAHYCFVTSVSAAIGAGDAAAPLIDDSFHGSMAALELHANATADSGPAWLGNARIALATGYLAMNDGDRAHACALKAVDALPPEGDPHRAAQALRVFARSEIALGDLNTSVRAARDALRLFESIGARAEVTITLLVLAEVEAARGDRVALAGYLGEAYALADALELPLIRRTVLRLAAGHTIAI